MSKFGYIAGSVGIVLMTVGMIMAETAIGIALLLCGMLIFAITAWYEGYI